jgi:hypothetical protein
MSQLLTVLTVTLLVFVAFVIPDVAAVPFYYVMLAVQWGAASSPLWFTRMLGIGLIVLVIIAYSRALCRAHRKGL